VLRALDVLAEVNRQRSASVPDLLRSLPLPRPTLIRLLNTLEGAGYLVRGPPKRHYEATPKVAALAAGFNAEAWLVAVSTPILLDLLGQVGWPSDVMTLGGNEIHVRNSNRPQCGFNIDAQFIGMRSPLAQSASGRALLAWCSEGERRRLLPLCVSRQGEQALLRELETTRARGYGAREATLKPHVGAIAVPVMHGGTVACCLDLVFLPAVERQDRVAARCLPALRAAAARLEAAYDTLYGAPLAGATKLRLRRPVQAKRAGAG
jgi:IclR family mhp operon transcriptional activator